MTRPGRELRRRGRLTVPGSDLSQATTARQGQTARDTSLAPDLNPLAGIEPPAESGWGSAAGPACSLNHLVRRAELSAGFHYDARRVEMASQVAVETGTEHRTPRLRLTIHLSGNATLPDHGPTASGSPGRRPLQKVSTHRGAAMARAERK
jgi:hypothetical protein